ncbi:hypothetical protein GH714_017244 [Hevea brasiliensis]|uniref:histidine kinase n=1 Tax=Hevea brasiliensis TaxID=3981 RepID=A0A6A6KC30_HEVBR|nr:hypothetical protein GH714_017244 [Hevea brasiliensis]
MLCCWIVSVISLNWFVNGEIVESKTGLLGDGGKMWLRVWEKISGNSCKMHHHYYQYIGSKRVRKTWWRRLLVAWVIGWIMVSLWILWYMSSQATEKRKRPLQACVMRGPGCYRISLMSLDLLSYLSWVLSLLGNDNSKKLIHNLKFAEFACGFDFGILKLNPEADLRTFARYTERTAFERPLTSGVAYAVRVHHSEREQFEKQQGWTIKRMDTLEQNPVHKDDYTPELLEPSPIQEEYAPVIFAQDTISHVVSLDMLSGKEDRENVLRARESGTGVLTAPFRLLKTKRLGVILTFAVYKRDIPSNATPNERIQATDGYLGGVFDIELLVEKLLQQLASEQTIIVDVYDTTNQSHPISMYGSNVSDDGLQHVSSLNFGDPHRKHEMHCRFKQKPPWQWLAITTSFGVLVIALLIGHIFHATVNRIAKVEDDYHEMMELKKRAEAADIAKSQFLATVSHEIRTPMNGVLGMLHMLMDTDLDVTQRDYVRTAQASGKALVSLINEVLDQAKIESGKLELEDVQFNLRAILDDVLSLFSDKSQGKGVEGVPANHHQSHGKFNKRHIFVTVHLVEEVIDSIDIGTEPSSRNTLSGLPIADRRRSWAGFRAFSQEGSSRTLLPSPPDLINLIVSVEDTGEGIPLESQSRIFTPFMQVGPSTSRKYGGTGIGLSISKCLVGLMNGEIGFVSIPKIGTTFTFTAVFANGCSNLNEYKSHKIGNQSNTIFSEFQGMTALVVDPRPVRAKVSRYHIQRLGIHVEVVYDLNQALCSISNENAVVNMVLIEQEVWDRDSSVSALFVSTIMKIDRDVSPKLFLLANSISSSKTNTATSGVYTLSAIMKPLRANDNGVNLKVAAGALKKYGADVVCAESGEKAIKLLTPPHQFDACFMDIQMPEMDGFEATQKIRDKEHNFNNSIQNGDASVGTYENVPNWHVPILAMTADVIQATHEECRKCGMDGYVSKPFEAEQLYREVSRFFQSTSNVIL